MPLDGDLVGHLLGDVDRHERRRDVGDLAVQGIRRVALGPVGIPGLHLVGGAVVLQAAAGQQFVEAVEPAEPPRRAEVDVRRIHRPVLDGGIPAQPEPAIRPVPEPHPARRHDRHPEGAVVDLDQVHAIPPPAAQGPLGDRPRARRRLMTLEARRVDGEALQPMLPRDIGQHIGSHSWISNRDEEGGRGNGDRIGLGLPASIKGRPAQFQFSRPRKLAAAPGRGDRSRGTASAGGSPLGFWRAAGDCPDFPRQWPMTE